MGRRSPDTSYKPQSARRVTTIAVEPHSLTQRTTPIIRVPHTTRRLNRPYAQASAGSTWEKSRATSPKPFLTDTLLLMKDHLIGSVPAHLVDAARPTLTAHEGLVADYNIAAWLHLPDACDLLVSLVVSYLDGGRQREVAVDHGRIDRQQRILLSGIARLPVRQKVENMQVRLKSATAFSRLVVEEFFVQAVEQENRSQQVSKA